MIFKPESIKAIVEGRKTQTRRVIKPQPKRIDDAFDGTWEWKEKGHYYDDLTLVGVALKGKSRYQVGEMVYIKEAWGLAINEHGHSCLCYKSSNDDDMALDRPQSMRLWDNDKKQWVLEQTESPYWYPDRWRSPLFMPEWAARHFITITDVRAERVQGISKADCIAEGTPDYDGWFETWRDCFKVLWNSINKDYPFESNPWVFPYTFRLEVK